MSTKRIRRTHEQLEAGMSVIDVRSGISVEDFLKKKKEREKQDSEAKLAEAKHSLKKAGVTEMDNASKVVEIIKIIYGEDESTGRSAQQIIDEVFANCRWEWKSIPLDKTFKAKTLDDLGKDRWRLVFTHDPKISDKTSNKPVLLCFQRALWATHPKRKKQSTI